MLMKTSKHRRASLKRLLGLSLLVFVIYGTTVEAAHRHGRATTSHGQSTALGNPDVKGNKLNAPAGCSDCLICQLHQNFSTTLISVKLDAAPLIRVADARKSEPVSISSIAFSPESGRAPPQAN